MTLTSTGAPETTTTSEAAIETGMRKRMMVYGDCRCRGRRVGGRRGVGKMCRSSLIAKSSTSIMLGSIPITAFYAFRVTCFRSQWKTFSFALLGSRRAWDPAKASDVPWGGGREHILDSRWRISGSCVLSQDHELSLREDGWTSEGERVDRGRRRHGGGAESLT